MPKVPGSRVPGRSDLIARLAKVRELSQSGSNAEALVLAKSIASEAATRGLAPSVHLEWVLAVVSDREGILEEAVRHCVNAVEMDPLDPAADNSMDIIAHHANDVLVYSAPWGARGWALFNLMAENGLASEAVQGLADEASSGGAPTSTAIFGMATRGVA